MPAVHTPFSWVIELKDILGTAHCKTLAVLQQHADAKHEKYRLMNLLLTDPEIGAHRYIYPELQQHLEKILSLQNDCLTGIKVPQEEWSPPYTNAQTQSRVYGAKVERELKKRRKDRIPESDIALLERNACIADILDNAAYHSYGLQNPAAHKAVCKALVAAEGFEAKRKGHSAKDAEKRAQAKLQSKIFELLKAPHTASQAVAA